MAGIFISYRRDDSIAYAGRLYDRLVARFGKDQVFMDIDDLQPGEDFVDALQSAVSSCNVLIAVIGKNWLSAKDDAGNPRLHNPEDFVHLEIVAALLRGIRVIPALVGGALMPTAVSLPDPLKKLARRQAIQLPDIGFPQSVSSLIETLESVIAQSAPASGGEGAKPPDRLESLPRVRQAAAGTSGSSGPAAPAARSPETWSDPETGLMWTTLDNAEDIGWAHALEYVREYSQDGFSDWRMPSIVELEKLYSPREAGTYKIRGGFQLSSHWVWSSTVDESGEVWAFHFIDGSRGLLPMTHAEHVRVLCVREAED